MRNDRKARTYEEERESENPSESYGMSCYGYHYLKLDRIIYIYFKRF